MSQRMASHLLTFSFYSRDRTLVKLNQSAGHIYDFTDMQRILFGGDSKAHAD